MAINEGIPERRPLHFPSPNEILGETNKKIRGTSRWMGKHWLRLTLEAAMIGGGLGTGVWTWNQLNKSTPATAQERSIDNIPSVVPIAPTETATVTAAQLPSPQATPLSEAFGSATPLPELTPTKTETQSSLPTNLPTKGSRIEKFGGGLKDIIIEVKNPSGYETRPLEQFQGAVYGLKGTELPGSDLLGFYGQDDKFYVITSIKNKTFQVALPEDLLDNTPAVAAEPTLPPVVLPAAPTQAPPPTLPAPSPTQKTELTPTPAAPVERELTDLNIPGVRFFNISEQFGIDVWDNISGSRTDNITKLINLSTRYVKDGRKLEIRFYDNVNYDSFKDQSKKNNFFTYFAQKDNNITRVYIAPSAGSNLADLYNPGSLLSGQLLNVINSVVLENFFANNIDRILTLQNASPSRPPDIKLARPAVIGVVPISKIAFITHNENGIIGGIKREDKIDLAYLPPSQNPKPYPYKQPDGVYGPIDEEQAA